MDIKVNIEYNKFKQEAERRIRLGQQLALKAVNSEQLMLY